ncbi:MAG: tetratricopeptide (TPR) repeat protein [Chlamydiales bacterium]|jgi:tetratricopeptide (TPR) repeat protein
MTCHPTNLSTIITTPFRNPRKRQREDDSSCSLLSQRMRLPPPFEDASQSNRSHFPDFSFAPSLLFSSFDPGSLQNEITSLSGSQSSSIKTLLSKICRQQELILQKLEKQSQVLENQERILEELRSEHTLFTSRGCDYLNAGRLEEALNEFNSALSRHPTDSYTLTKRGEVFFKLSSLERAEHDFTEALKFDGKNQPALIKLAEIKISNEEIEDALQLLNNLLLQSPDHIEALTLRGKIHRIMGTYGSSLEDIEHALAISPNNPIASEERQLSLSKHMDSLGFYC